MRCDIFSDHYDSYAFCNSVMSHYRLDTFVPGKEERGREMHQEVDILYFSCHYCLRTHSPGCLHLMVVLRADSGAKSFDATGMTH